MRYAGRYANHATLAVLRRYDVVNSDQSAVDVQQGALRAITAIVSVQAAVLP